MRATPRTGTPSTAHAGMRWQSCTTCAAAGHADELGGYKGEGQYAYASVHSMPWPAGWLVGVLRWRYF